MRKRLACAIVFVFWLSFIPESSAATKQELLIVAFESYEADNTTKYQNEVSRIENTYQPKIQTTSSEILSLKNQFSNLQSKVISQGNNRNYWGYFKCTSIRPDCIGIDKGPQFQTGEVINFIPEAGSKKDYLLEIEQITKTGIIELLDPTKYQTLSASLINKIDYLDSLNKTYSAEKLAAKIENDKVQDISMAISALDRVGKSSANIEKSFVIALKYEYNLKRLDQLASTPWSSINNLKSLNSAVKVAKLSATADYVSENYTLSKATSVNNSCGNVFTNEESFKTYFSFVSTIYKQVTKGSLKG
jgi:hypothetical protein